MQDIVIEFPGGKRVDARVGHHVVHTDQPLVGGGEDSAPSPFELFLASLATCTGLYVLGFCQARNLSVEGIGLRQSVEVDPETQLPRAIRIELSLPASFPEKYRGAIVRAAEGCKVKKTLRALPTVEVSVASMP